MHEHDEISGRKTAEIRYFLIGHGMVVSYLGSAWWWAQSGVKLSPADFPVWQGNYRENQPNLALVGELDMHNAPGFLGLGGEFPN